MGRTVRIFGLALVALTAAGPQAIARTGHMHVAAADRAAPWKQSADWQQSYYDSAHAGYNRNEHTLSPHNVSHLQLRWVRGVQGGGVQCCNVQMLVVDDGIVFAQSVEVPGWGVILSAFDAATGQLLWTKAGGYADGYNEFGDIAAAGGLLFAECEPPDTVTGICASDAKSGRQVWAFGPPGDSNQVTGPLVYANGIVYFTYCGYPCPFRQSATIYALDAASGTVLGQYLSPYRAGAVPDGNIIVSGGYLYSGNAGGLFAMNLRTEQVPWVYSHGNIDSGSDSISVQGGVLYDNFLYAFSGGVLALDAANGKQLWMFSYPQGYPGQVLPPAVASGIVYVTGFELNDGATLYALDAQTGELLGSSDALKMLPGYVTPPSVANGVVYAQLNNGSTIALDMHTGARLFATAGAGGYAYYQAPPIVANGALYTGCGEFGNVCAYGLPGQLGR